MRTFDFTDAFDKLQAHLRHSCYDGGCTICDDAIHSVHEDARDEYEYGYEG